MRDLPLTKNKRYEMKPAAAVVSSRYWNMVNGSTPEQVREDQEGLRNLRMLAKNMIWLLRCKEAGEKMGIPLPEYN